MLLSLKENSLRSLMYQIEITTKRDKVYQFQTPDLEAFCQSLSKSEIIWTDNQTQGYYFPASEIAQILFRKQSDDSQATTPQPSGLSVQEIAEESQNYYSECCQHQQHQLEG